MANYLEKTTYFGTLPTNTIGGELMRRVKAYYDFVWRSGRLDLWRLSRAHYNASRVTQGRVQERGQQGEYLVCSVNHFGSILQNQVSLVTAQKVAWEPKASNTDYRSQVQTVLAKGLLDYYVREKGLDADLTRVCEFFSLYGEAAVLIEWDPRVGEVHIAASGGIDVPTEDVPTEGAPVEDVPNEGVSNDEVLTEDVPTESTPAIFKGDIVSTVLSPIDLIRDTMARNSVQTHPWLIVRKFRNKFELALAFPEYHDEIIALSYTKTPEEHDTLDSTYFATDYEEYNDDIPVYTFYHNKTPLLPDGRMIEFLTDEIVLTDSPLPYAAMPVKWGAYREEDEHPFGYSQLWDLLPIQKVIDSLHSSLATNHKHFGLNILMVPRGAGWDISKAASGLSVIEVDPTLPRAAAPQAISLLGNHTEAMNYLQILVKEMETLSGINSVARGNPEASLRSHAAVARVLSVAVQFAHGLQKSYFRILEGVGTLIISHLKAFADLPRVAEITGKSKRGVLMEFQGSDLEFVNRVSVEEGSPLSKTLAGRVSLVEMLLQQGALTDPKDLIAVIETGSLESQLESDTGRLLLIRAENEALEDGTYPVQALIIDEHLVHLQEHGSVLSSPSSRQDPELVQRVLTHIMEHIQFLLDPANATLLAALGQTSLAPPPVAPSEEEPTEEGLSAENLVEAPTPTP